MNPPELPDALLPTSPLSPGTAPQRKFATMKLSVPDGVDLMSDTDLRAALQAQETRESMAPSNRREKAILGATQLNWRGHPILWTCGRLTLFQALGETTGAESIPGFNPNRPFMDAVIFVFLATHPETVWEQSRYVKFDGKDLTLPPLVADFANFYSVIRHWGDTYIGPDPDVLRELSRLQNETFALHNSTKAVPVPEDGDPLTAEDDENFTPGPPENLSSSPE